MKRIVATIALILGGCAAQEVHHPVVGPPLTAVNEEEAGALLNDLRLDLKEISLEQIGGKHLAPHVSGSQMIAEIPTEWLFEQGNAQVRVAALKPLAEIAQDVAARGGCVVHVIGLSGVDDDLIERRAASIADDFAHHAIAQARLRFESRLAGKGDDSIVIVLKPVVIGHEVSAWTSPVLGE